MPIVVDDMIPVQDENVAQVRHAAFRCMAARFFVSAWQLFGLAAQVSELFVRWGSRCVRRAQMYFGSRWVQQVANNLFHV